jgi:hypothetical protein
MKQFISRHKNNMLVQALSSGSILSIFVYIILRCLFYEFGMGWTEEIMFFIKTMLASSCIIATATGGSAWLYRGLVKMRRR